MRRYLLSMTVAGFLGLMAFPAAAGVIPEKDDVVETAGLSRSRAALPFPGLRDEAAMVIVGTALIGLAAAVRRAA